MSGTTNLVSGGYRVKKGEYVHNALVGLEEPSPFISALFSFTAKADKEQAMREKEHAHKATAPANALARQIKAFSLFPNIYSKPKAIGPDA